MGRRFAIVFCASLTACLIPDLYPLSGGTVGNDGGAGSDASADAGADATPGTDATPDGFIPGDGGGRFCDTVKTATFCDDFDVGTFGAAWLTPQLSGTGSTLLPSTPARSSPFAARSKVTGPQVSFQGASMRKEFGGTYGVMDFSYALYLVKKPTTAGLEVGDLGIFGASEKWYCGLILVSSSDQGFFEHDKSGSPNQYASSPLAAPIPTGKWVQIAWHLELDPARGGPAVTLKVDGVTAYAAAITPSFGFAKGSLFASAGIVYADPVTDGGEILVDDVVVTVGP